MHELSPYIPPSLTRVTAGERTTPAFPLPVDRETGTLRAYWSILSTHRAQIVKCAVGVTLTAVLCLLLWPPTYTAQTVLLIEPKSPPVMIDTPLGSDSGASGESDYYKTQYEILKGYTLAARVITEQGLKHDRLFTGEDGVGLVGSVVAAGRQRGQALLASFSTPAPYLHGEHPRLVEAYRNSLTIVPLPETRLVTVKFRSPDPGLSARIANAHAVAYIRDGLRMRTHTSEEAQGFLAEKLQELKARVETSEAALHTYRRESAMLSLDEKDNIIVDRLTDLNRRLTEAEADRIALEAQVHLIRQGEQDALPAVLSSTLIQNLKEQLAGLESEHQAMAVPFKEGYPKFAQHKAQVVETRKRLTQEIQRVVSGVTVAHRTAQNKEQQLRAKMEEQKTVTLKLKDASVGYAILSREAEANRQLYDSVLQRRKEMEMAAALRASNVSVIDMALPPLTSDAHKQLPLVLSLSVLLGVGAGVGLAFVREHLGNTLKSAEDVERWLRLPTLTTVPDFAAFQHPSVSERLGSSRLMKSLARLHGSLRHLKSLPLLRGFFPSPASEQLDSAHLIESLAHPRDSFPRHQDPTAPEVQWAHTFSVQADFSPFPPSLLTEAYRTLRTALLLSQAERPPKTILFTSATHAEGKTVTVLNTARVFADLHARVLVIDADLRRPSCSRILLPNGGAGLTELLAGQVALIATIKFTSVPSLFFLSSGAIPPNPVELVGSRKMQELLTELRDHFDYIFIDAPPLLPVSDAVLLSTMVDGVVVVTDSQRTSRPAVREACARLAYAHAKVLGVVLNKVDMRHEDSYYGYGEAYTQQGNAGATTPSSVRSVYAGEAAAHHQTV